MSADGEREPVEHALLEEVRKAELAYREAVALSQAIVEDRGKLPFGHSEKDRVRLEIAEVEAAALDRYRNAVKNFSDLVLYGCQPDGKTESSSRDQAQLR